MITAIQLKALEEPEKAHVSHIVWWYLVTVLFIYPAHGVHLFRVHLDYVLYVLVNAEMNMI